MSDNCLFLDMEAEEGVVVDELNFSAPAQLVSSATAPSASSVPAPSAAEVRPSSPFRIPRKSPMDGGRNRNVERRDKRNSSSGAEGSGEKRAKIDGRQDRRLRDKYRELNEREEHYS